MEPLSKTTVWHVNSLFFLTAIIIRYTNCFEFDITYDKAKNIFVILITVV